MFITMPKRYTVTVLKTAIVIMLNICLILFAAIITDAPLPVLSRQGSSGEQVRQIQTRLRELGFLSSDPDGIYGVKTAEAVRQFQQSKGIAADGVAGVVTLSAHNINFRQGSSGEDVANIQKKLSSLGYYTDDDDGVFGPGTADAVKAFQKANGLSEDGIVGFSTAKTLYSSSAKRRPSSGGVLSDSDYQLLARIISAESRGEPYIGQVAVGAVVLNRVNHPSFPDTIAGVVYQPGAFTAITDGQINEAIAESSYRAAREALNGSDPSGGAIYYFNPDKTDNKWIRTRPVIKRIGAHLFCS